MNSQFKLLLKIRAEGGFLAIYGTSDTTGKRQYRFQFVDSTFEMMGREEGGATIRRDSGWLDSWDAAIEALSAYSWPRLPPAFVAPEVAVALWSALKKFAATASKDTGAINLRKWRRDIRGILGVLPDHPLAPFIGEALADSTFAGSWKDNEDLTFRPYVAAILTLRAAPQMSAEERQALVREICEKRRVKLLSEVLGAQIPERVLQWSRRTAWEDFSISDWNEFFSIALAEDRHSALTGVRTINCTLLIQFPLIPQPLRRKGLLNMVSQLYVPRHRWRSLAASFAKVDPAMRPSLLRLAAIMQYRGEFWDLYYRCKGNYWRPFRLPATLPQSELLEPILSPLEMDAEALLMQNCLSSRTSRVLSSDRIYFRMRDTTSVNAELKREPVGWVPGDIRGPENAEVPDDIDTKVRNELSRMGRAITGGPLDPMPTHEYVEMLRGKARKIFSRADVDVVTEHLAAIHGKSLSWTQGAYVIFKMRCGGFVQFMCSPDAEEYLGEIQSYKFQIKAGEYLDAQAVDLIERAGFLWPTHKDNFKRWFKVSTSAEIQHIAEFALAALHRLFHCRSLDEIEVKSHVPSDPTNSG